MESKLDGPALTAAQRPERLPVAMYLRTLKSEHWDSGFDSDEPSLFQPSLQLSDDSSDEDFLDNAIQDKKNGDSEPLKDMENGQRESLDIMIKWRQNGDVRESSISESTADRSSPPLYEVELTASDEDDDASVLELVIPMQSRYQRVPTSSPKKTKPKNTSLLSSLFCCMRK